MTDSPPNVSVTLYLMAFNQAAFIRQAIEGALRQTFSPMQIVLSDDCSTDDTFEIMKDVAQAYSGPHTIVLNRNESNLGISAHLNRIMSLATGDLIVAADGDDISEPHRVQRYVDVWLERGRPAALASSVFCIDVDGKLSDRQDGSEVFGRFVPLPGETNEDALIRFLKEGSPRLTSCSAGWTKELFDAFGPLPPGIWHEDDLMTLRAWLYDRIEFIQEPLVAYREHGANVYNRVPVRLASVPARYLAEQSTQIVAQRRREAFSSYAPDLEFAARQGWITRSMHSTLKRLADSHSRRHQIIEEWWTMGWGSRLARCLTFMGSGHFQESRWCSPRLLPFRIFLALAAIWSRRRGLPPFGTVVTSLSVDGLYSFIALW